MRSATEPPDADLELFRSVRSDQVLRGCGNVFREKDEYTASAGALPTTVTARLLDRAAAAYYRRSEPCARADAFVSHAWHDDHRLKYLALCYRHNLGSTAVARRSPGSVFWFSSLPREYRSPRLASPPSRGAVGLFLKPYFARTRPWPGLRFMLAQRSSADYASCLRGKQDVELFFIARNYLVFDPF